MKKLFLSTFKKPASDIELALSPAPHTNGFKIFNQPLPTLLKNDSLKNTKLALDDLIDGDNEHIPCCFRDFIRVLDREEVISTQGIFRIAASNKTARELKEKFDRESDFPLIWTLFKTFLRDLPNGLITHQCFINLSKQASISQLTTIKKTILSDIPTPNLQVLIATLLYLQRVNFHKKENKMDFVNLAKIFSQCLIKFDSDDGERGGVGSDGFVEVEVANRVVLFLLDNFWTIFGDLVTDLPRIAHKYGVESTPAKPGSRASFKTSQTPYIITNRYMPDSPTSTLDSGWSTDDGRETPELLSYPSPTPSQNILIKKMVNQTVGKVLFGVDKDQIVEEEEEEEEDKENRTPLVIPVSPIGHIRGTHQNMIDELNTIMVRRKTISNPSKAEKVEIESDKEEEFYTTPTKIVRSLTNAPKDYQVEREFLSKNILGLNSAFDGLGVMNELKLRMTDEPKDTEKEDENQTSPIKNTTSSPTKLTLATKDRPKRPQRKEEEKTPQTPIEILKTSKRDSDPLIDNFKLIQMKAQQVIKEPTNTNDEDPRIKTKISPTAIKTPVNLNKERPLSAQKIDIVQSQTSSPTTTQTPISSTTKQRPTSSTPSKQSPTKTPSLINQHETFKSEPDLDSNSQQISPLIQKKEIEFVDVTVVSKEQISADKVLKRPSIVKVHGVMKKRDEVTTSVKSITSGRSQSKTSTNEIRINTTVGGSSKDKWASPINTETVSITKTGQIERIISQKMSSSPVQQSPLVTHLQQTPTKKTPASMMDILVSEKQLFQYGTIPSDPVSTLAPEHAQKMKQTYRDLFKKLKDVKDNGGVYQGDIKFDKDYFLRLKDYLKQPSSNDASEAKSSSSSSPSKSSPTSSTTPSKNYSSTPTLQIKKQQTPLGQHPQQLPTPTTTNTMKKDLSPCEQSLELVAFGKWRDVDLLSVEEKNREKSLVKVELKKLKDYYRDDNGPLKLSAPPNERSLMKILHNRYSELSRACQNGSAAPSPVGNSEVFNDSDKKRLEELRVKKKAIQKTLNAFQEKFALEHGRPMQGVKDRGPIMEEYRMYKEIKEDISYLESLQSR